MFTRSENKLQGRDFRSEISGIDYDDVLRDAVQNHITHNSRTVEDIAHSLRVEADWLRRWLDGEEQGTMDLLSALCANTQMNPTDIFSYSAEYASTDNVTPFKQLLVKRLANSWSEADLMLALRLANMIMTCPSSAAAVNQGVLVATRVAELQGYDTEKVLRGLEHVKNFQRNTGVGAGTDSAS